MNDFTMYEVAKQRQAELLAGATSTAPSGAALARRRRRLARTAARQKFALALRRLADRIEPDARRPRHLSLPAQRGLVG